MADKLKPCPFCGDEEPELDYVGQMAWRVICYRCGAEINPLRPTEDGTVAAWNKRVDNHKRGKLVTHFEHWSPYQQCSVCGFEIPLTATGDEEKLRLYKHCPECAARLEGSDDDASD